MLDYIDSACKAWGRTTRWILADTNEGFPHRDTIRMAAEGLLSAHESIGRGQHFPEVRVNGALQVARAMKVAPHMPLPLTATVWAQYVIKGPTRCKLLPLSRYLGDVISIAEYWRNLDRAHYFLSARIDPPICHANGVGPREVRA